MSDTHPEVEFLDPAGQDADGVDWLDEEGLGAGGTAVLPPRTTVRRIAGSLAVFALGVSVTGFAGLSAYRHDQSVAAAADALILREVNVGDAVTLTDPGQIDGPGGWRVDPSASIAVAVTNESPDAITLLPGTTLIGSGLTQPATLTPSGATTLQPGQRGELVGTATVDCGMQVQGAAGPSAVVRRPQGNSVIVQARTASGAVGMASLAVGAAATPAVRDEICSAQGDGLAASFFPASVDAATHTFTVAIDAHSLAAQSLRYLMQAGFDNVPTGYSGTSPDLTIELSDGKPVTSGLSIDAVERLLPGVRLAAATPIGPVQGVLAPNDTVDTGFSVHVLSCPSTMPTAQADVVLDMYVNYRGQPAYFQADSFNLGMLVAAACDIAA
jgi:hypothetical protein